MCLWDCVMMGDPQEAAQWKTAQLLRAEMEPSSEMGSGWGVHSCRACCPCDPTFKDPIDSIVVHWHCALWAKRQEAWTVRSPQLWKLLSSTIWAALWQGICFTGIAWRFTSNLLEVLMVAWVIYPVLRVSAVRRHPVLELSLSCIMKTFNLSYMYHK